MSAGYPYPGIIVDPQGVSTSVAVTDDTGATATVYSDRYGVSAVVMPQTITAPTTYYVPGEGPWTVTATVDGTALAAKTVTLADAQVATITVPVLSARNTQLAAYVPAIPITGADPTGVADSSAAIQAALNTANTNGGGQVYIPSGTYLINTNLAVYSNTTVRGAGASTILKTTDSTSRNHLAVQSAATNVLIESLACLGPGDQSVASGAVEPAAINLVANNQQVTVRNCWISNIAGFGIGIGTGCKDILIHGNQIQGCGNSGLADGHGISVETSSRLVIAHNVIRNCRYRGIEIFSGFAGGTHDVTVMGNSIYNTVATGIAVFASSNNNGAVEDVTVIGNTIDTVTSTSIFIGAGIAVGHMADHVTVTGNSVYNTGSDGIIVTESTSQTTGYEITVSANTIRFAGRHGIYSDGNATLSILSVSGNVVTDSFTDGIYLDGIYYSTVVGNLCINNGRQATGGTDYAGIRGNTVNWATITGNICRDTRAGASRTQTAGILCDNTSDNVTINGNTCTNHASANVLVAGSPTNSRISGCTGVNPRGPVGPPAVPASGVAQSNIYAFDVTVYVSGGTVSAIAVNSPTFGAVTTGLTAGAIRVPAGGQITLTYTVAPTWQWFAD